MAIYDKYKETGDVIDKPRYGAPKKATSVMWMKRISLWRMMNEVEGDSLHVDFAL